MVGIEISWSDGKLTRRYRPARNGESAPRLVPRIKSRLEMNAMSNTKSTNEDNLHIIITAIEGFVLGVNLFGMLFNALQIKSSMVIWQIVPSLLIMIQVPVLTIHLGFILYSLGFLL